MKIRVYRYVLLICTSLLPQVVLAYIGPGAGVGSLVSAIAFILIVVLLLLGFLWYPIKQILSHNREQKQKANSSKTSDSDEAQGL